jgi:hypothetical protein
MQSAQSVPKALTADTYEEDNGEVLGSLEAGSGNVLVGYWIEDQSASSCDEPKNGRDHWGRFRLVFTGDSFTGDWGYCDGELVSGWNGKRTN